MQLRADHVAGAAFVGFGALVIALSGDLPVGQLSMPGSGFLPRIVKEPELSLMIRAFGKTRRAARRKVAG